jgi:hypothetical protein
LAPWDHHEFYILTNQNAVYAGPAWTHLTAYIEQNHGVPRLAIQDGQNIDETKMGQNLVDITEYRAVAGCNGDSDGYGNGSCYPCDSVHCNGKGWKSDTIYFSETPGPYYKNDWHRIEAYFKLNSILNGKGVADGVLKYWFDGQLIINHEDVVIRTGQYPNMKFNQFVLGPWIGDGSPVDQSFWIDNLLIATSQPDNLPPAPPKNLRILDNWL